MLVASCRDTNRKPMLLHLIDMLGYTECDISEVLIDGNTHWYRVEEEMELGLSGDLYFRVLIAGFGKGGIISYCDGIELWGRSIASPELYDLYDSDTDEYARLIAAVWALCPPGMDAGTFSSDELELEESNSHHIAYVVNECVLPGSPASYDIFTNNIYYRQLLMAVKAAYMPYKGRAVMVLDDPVVSNGKYFSMLQGVTDYHDADDLTIRYEII